MADTLRSMGRIRHMKSRYLEGKGKKSGIGHRLWAADTDQGGQLLDMSTHIFYVPALLCGMIGDIHIEKCQLGFCDEARQEYRNSRGTDNIAETYAHVILSASNGCEIDFACGKYTGDAERWLIIYGENGGILLDFETQTMAVNSPAYTGIVQAEASPKYTIIMRDLERRIAERQRGDYMLDNSARTLGIILAAKENVTERFDYRNGEIPEQYK